jgi:hypothetical protein
MPGFETDRYGNIPFQLCVRNLECARRMTYKENHVSFSSVLAGWVTFLLSFTFLRIYF